MMKAYEQHAFYQYLNASATSLFDVYDKPSKNKQLALEQIKSGMLFVGGKELRILSHSCHTFSCAYLYRADDGIPYLAVFRPTRNFDVNVSGTVLASQI